MSNLYLQAFDAFPFPCLMLEPGEGNFIIKDVNSSYCRNFTVCKAEIIGKHFPLHLTERDSETEDFAPLLQSLQKVCLTGEIDTVVLSTNRKNFNRSSPSVWQNIPVKDDSGDVIQILSLVLGETRHNIENREKEGRFAVNSQEYENFVKKNKDGLYSLDLQGNFLNLNEGLCKMAELSEEEMLQTSFLLFCAPHDRERTLAHFHEVLQGKNQEFEGEFISAKGNVLVLEITLAPMEVDGKISGAYGIAKDKTPVKKREKEYHINEKRLKALVHEGLDMVGILEPDGTYKFASDTVKNVLGADPEFYIGKNAFDFIHPEDKENVMADFSMLGNEKQVKIRLFRFRDLQGEWRWMETMVTNLLDDPYIEGIVTNSREVTELVEKSHEIKQLYERYTLAAEATEDLIYDWDLITDDVIRFHKSNQRLWGYSRREVDAPDFWRSNIHPEDLPVVQENLKKHLEDEEQQHFRIQYRFCRADGTYAQIIDRSSILRNDNGKAIRLIGATLDISEIMSNKEALRMANRRFSYAMRATKEMIWDWDILKDRIKRSGSFRKIFGYGTSRSSSVEKFWFEKIPDKDRKRVSSSLSSALKDPEVKKWREEYCFLRKDGKEAHVIDRGYILRNSEGKAIRMIGAVLDVTESREMFNEIQKQNKVLKEVAWEQAHVVKAPLARLRGLLDLLEEESYEEWSREELVTLIKSSAEEVDEVIERIIRKTEKIGS